MRADELVVGRRYKLARGWNNPDRNADDFSPAEWITGMLIKSELTRHEGVWTFGIGRDATYSTTNPERDVRGIDAKGGE